jgi:hypothetical protein
MGVGVAIPFPADVVVGFCVDVGVDTLVVPPITLTQTYVSSHSDPQLLPTAGFHEPEIKEKKHEPPSTTVTEAVIAEKKAQKQRRKVDALEREWYVQGFKSWMRRF